MKKIVVGITWLTPVIIILTLINIFPLIYALILSFERWNLIANIHEYVGFRNYIDLFESSFFYHVLSITFLYTGLSVIVQFILGFFLALVFMKATEKNLKGIELARVIFISPLVVAPIIVGFYFRLIFSPQFGVLNLILAKIGLPQILWVHDPKLALVSLIGVDTWAWTPFVFTLLFSGLLALPKNIFEAASIDGSSGLRNLFYIIIPMMKPVILVVILLRFIDSIKYLDLIYIITKGGPGASTEIISYFAYRTGFNEFEMGLSSAIAYIEVLIIMFITFFLIMVNKKRKIY